MDQQEVEEIKQKRSPERDEIAALLSHEAEKRGELPNSRDLKDGDWPVSYYQVNSRLGSIDNLKWRLGEFEDSWSDEEIVRHEVRGLEHKLGRAPRISEVRKELGENLDESVLDEAGIPYRTNRYVEADEEDELLQEMKQEYKRFNNSVDALRVRTRYNDSEIDIFESYLPWIKEQDAEDVLSNESNAEVLRLMQDYESLSRIAEEVGLHPSDVQMHELRNRGFATSDDKGVYITPRGEEFLDIYD